ncbi:MAG: helix-turn-helix domain-containing protein, partial [Gemmatimonadota bacterium]
MTAALELLERDGPDGVTVQGVVQRADSSVGSFYARFGGKDDLLHYLAERVWDEALERWNAALEARAW